MPTRYSVRTSWSRAQNRLAELRERAQERGQPLLDLTESNPTRSGLCVPAELLQLLADPRGISYEPEPLGLPEARAAVVAYYRDRGLPAEPSHIVLTASSSEAYSWLFKLLADPGDIILVPQPSYPLLPMLAELEGVRLEPYPLMREERWRVDVAALRRCFSSEVRAVVLVHPNNPTGSLCRRDDAEAIAQIAADHGAALIVDEVFRDYVLSPSPELLPSFTALETSLCFVLSGLSKLCLLPQLKLGWIHCSGHRDAVAEALGRLELVADSFLSVSTAVQLAAPTLLGRASRLQQPLRERLLENLGALDQAISACGPATPVRRLPVQAGWYAMVEVPRTRSDEAWLERLATREGLLVHPGYFFDCREQGIMVLSLILEPACFREAIGRAVALWSAG